MRHLSCLRLGLVLAALLCLFGCSRTLEERPEDIPPPPASEFEQAPDTKMISEDPDLPAVPRPSARRPE
jgi:hypothetical protein